MAFATSNVRAEVQGSTKVLYGNWSGATGDGSGTVTVAGSKIFKADFCANDASGGPADNQLPWTTSLSGYLTTVTVTYPKTVTTGTFKIEYA